MAKNTEKSKTADAFTLERRSAQEFLFSYSQGQTPFEYENTLGGGNTYPRGEVATMVNPSATLNRVQQQAVIRVLADKGIIGNKALIFAVATYINTCKK